MAVVWGVVIIFGTKSYVTYREFVPPKGSGQMRISRLDNDVDGPSFNGNRQQVQDQWSVFKTNNMDGTDRVFLDAVEAAEGPPLFVSVFDLEGSTWIARGFDVEGATDEVDNNIYAITNQEKAKALYDLGKIGGIAQPDIDQAIEGSTANIVRAATFVTRTAASSNNFGDAAENHGDAENDGAGN